MSRNISNKNHTTSNWIELVIDDVPQGFYYYFLSGIDFELHGNGGYKCLNYIEPIQKVIETGFAIIVCSISICYSGFPYLINKRYLNILLSFSKVLRN